MPPSTELLDHQVFAVGAIELGSSWGLALNALTTAHLHGCKRGTHGWEILGRLDYTSACSQRSHRTNVGTERLAVDLS